MSAARISAQKIAELERRIGHRFNSHERLVRALTHASATRPSGEKGHYERLEFLGDRVLGLCIAEMLFSAFPNAQEGELSVRLNALVSGQTCAEIADEIGLHNFIFAGVDVKHIAGKRMRSVRADVTESLIAAVYLDGGLTAAKSFIEKFWSQRIHSTGAGTQDGKTALQEWAHTAKLGTPIYRVAQRTGPDHDPTFVMEIVLNDKVIAEGSGRSKRIAEQSAAKTVLLREGIWEELADGTIKETNK